MPYNLKLDNENRILSACVCLGDKQYPIMVEGLPEGNISDYIYIDGEYFYDPLPTEVEIYEPSTEERISAIEDVLLELMGV